MAHVVAEPCVGCKYTDCVVVCPVECFYEGEQMVYIHPEECIDCEACVPECPVEAIFHEDNLSEEWKPYAQLNAEMATQCPVILEKKDPLCELHAPPAKQNPKAKKGASSNRKPAKNNKSEKSQTPDRGKTQGFGTSVEDRKLIEDAAMQSATSHFRGLGWEVQDVSKNQPYDLLCTKGKQHLYVEVKGTVTEGEQILLTSNEVKFARQNRDRMVLFILHGIEYTRLEGGKISISAKQPKVISPWDVDEGQLATKQYTYRIPEE